MFFPVFIDLEGKEVLVIGAGKIAYKKIKKILEYGAKVTVYSKNIIEKEILNLEEVKVVNKDIEMDESIIKELVKKYAFVISATDNHDLNELVADICIKNNILINNVSSKTKMNAMFAGIVKNDEFQIAVSTNGVNCKRSRAMKTEIQKVLDKVEKISKKEN